MGLLQASAIIGPMKIHDDRKASRPQDVELCDNTPFLLSQDTATTIFHTDLQLYYVL